MAKKRISYLILSILVSGCASLFLSNKKNDVSSVNAEETPLVEVDHVEWNNCDYSKTSGVSLTPWSGNVDENFVPQDGYCILPFYKSNIATTTIYDQNVLESSITGCNIGDYFLINGIEAKNVDDVIVYIFPQNGFFLYVPTTSITFTSEYEYLTIDVLDGASFDGSAYLKGCRFEYRGLLKSHGNWQINPEPIEKKQAELHHIEWNNLDYSQLSGLSKTPWTKRISVEGFPLDGYCILPMFNEIGKDLDKTVIGDEFVSGRGVLGIGLEVDHKIKVNGQNIIDVADSIVYIFPKNGLFIYLPEASITYDEEHLFPSITFEEGLHFNNVCLPSITFEFRGEIGETGLWEQVKDPSEYRHTPFTNVAGGWNNVPADALHTHTILQFGEYGVDYLRNCLYQCKNCETKFNSMPEEKCPHCGASIDNFERVSNNSDINLATRLGHCGRDITINGIAIGDIGDCVVSYAHGSCYVYLLLPRAALVKSNGYRVVTLHIAQDTIFYDTMLGEVTLYLFNGEWVLEKPETPLISDYDYASSLEDIHGVDSKTLNKDDKTMVAEKTLSVNHFGVFFDYKLLDENSGFSYIILGSTEENGIKLVFSKNTIMLYDTTENNVLLGSASFGLFNYDEWYSVLVFTKEVDNNLSLCVAVDDITYIHINNLEFGNIDNIGNKFAFNLNDGTVLIKNAHLDADNKKPIISYIGKSVYGVLAGTEAIDFTNRCTSFDEIDGDVTDLLVFKWQDGALTDNKVNKGTWKVTIISVDKSNNKAEMFVTVIAANKLEVIVTFDGNNPTTYKVGDHISMIPDPKKEEGDIKYEFVGWYLNDKPWDFENDYVTEDINLVSKFKELQSQFIVTFTSEGLENSDSFIMYFASGAFVDTKIFEKEGYSLKAYVDDKEVETFKVTKNTIVKLVYSSNNPPKEKSNLGLIIGCSAGGAVLLAGIGVGLFFFLKKRKGGK